MKNENKVDEVVDILSTLQEYVPTQKLSANLKVPGKDEMDKVTAERMHQLLFGGDQLTVARAKGAQRVRENSQHAMGRLEGFVPVVEDWHAKVCLLEVLSTCTILAYSPCILFYSCVHMRLCR